MYQSLLGAGALRSGQHSLVKCSANIYERKDRERPAAQASSHHQEHHSGRKSVLVLGFCHNSAEILLTDVTHSVLVTHSHTQQHFLLWQATATRNGLRLCALSLSLSQEIPDKFDNILQ